MRIRSGIMEFDHVVRVDDQGRVTDANGVYAPNLCDDQLDDESWELLDGYSGQYGYSGPIMHPSEFVGGGMERDILARPGLYVALVNHITLPDDAGHDDDVDGWAVAYQAEAE